MKATKFLSACSVALALMVVAPALAQQEELPIRDPETAEVPLIEESETQDSIPMSVPFIVRQVGVECNGGCGDSTLGQICGSGWIPIAVDCANVQECAGGSCNSPPVFACGGNNRCARYTINSGDLLGWYCDDTSGWDANVYCAQ